MPGHRTIGATPGAQGRLAPTIRPWHSAQPPRHAALGAYPPSSCGRMAARGGTGISVPSPRGSRPLIGPDSRATCSQAARRGICAARPVGTSLADAAHSLVEDAGTWRK